MGCKLIESIIKKVEKIAKVKFVKIWHYLNPRKKKVVPQPDSSRSFVITV